MTSIAEFTLPANGFPLGRVLEARPELRFELDRIIPAADTFMPYFWVYGSNLDDVLAAFEGLPELRSVALIEDLGDGGLFRAAWNSKYDGVMDAIAESDVTVLSATGSAAGWAFQLRAESPDEFSAFQRSCEGNGVDATLARLGRVTEPSPEAESDLTPDQREALLLAYEEGYFAEPRETDLESLAARLDISRQAFSSRLRRGYRNLIESALARDR